MKLALTRLAGVASGLVLIASAAFCEAFVCDTADGCTLGSWNPNTQSIDYVGVPKGHIADPAAGWVLGDGDWVRVP